jgi:hypothetical protein
MIRRDEMNRKKELEKIMDSARKELTEILDAEWLSENQQYVGKFFKFHNSYGDEEKWWLYFTVTHILGNSLYGWSFERDSRNNIRIDLEHYGLVNESIQITPDEFYGEWKKLLKQLEEVRERE